MDSLRSRLEALLEQDLYKSSYPSIISDSPLLSQDMFYIETPIKLKEPSKFSNVPCPASAYNTKKVVQYPSQSFASKPPLPEKSSKNIGFFFADPTPLSLISDSPLVTPLRFLH